jgi:hypothetical protein
VEIDSPSPPIPPVMIASLFSVMLLSSAPRLALRSNA